MRSMLFVTVIEASANQKCVGVARLFSIAAFTTVGFQYVLHSDIEF